MLEIVGLARSVFFYHLKPKADKDAYLKERILEEKAKDEQYGYRRIAAAIKANRKVIQRIIQQMGWQVRCKKGRKYNSYRGEVGKIAKDHLQRDFHATAPNQKLLTDITEFKANDGKKCYLSPIFDLFNNEIIAYNLSDRPNAAQVHDMLNQAFSKLPKGAKPILHSDQGWQYQMPSYQRALRERGIIQSMSRKGNCLDNAPMESFFGRLKTECFHGRTFATIEAVKQTIIEYIRYYNEKRIQLKLKGLSPIQYREQSLRLNI